MLGNKLIQDSKGNQISYFDNLDIQTNEKSTFTFSHERDIKVNLGELKKQVPKGDRAKAIIQFEIVLTNKKNEQLGLIEMPLFIGKDEQINRQENKILSKRNKDKLVPQKQELEFRIDLLEQEEEKKYDNTKGFMIEIQQITNYREKLKAQFEIKIICGNELLRDYKGNKLDFECKYPSTINEKSKISKFEQSIEIPLNIQMIKDTRKKELYKVYALIIFQIEKVNQLYTLQYFQYSFNFIQKAQDLKEDYGWFAHRLFENEIFNEGEFDETIYKPPAIETFPIDPKKMRKLTSKIQFEVKEVKVSI